ncbi:MAG: SDR family NAD(P)-dependent oxidoreductase [Woeseiaceae bacterium]
MSDALKGLYFFSRFAYPFSALGYRQKRMFFKDRPIDFRDQQWLVTGASGGIGRAIAVDATAHGAAVTAVARSPEKLSQLVADAGENILPRPTELSLASEVDGLLDELATWPSGATIDVLVNNVGVLLNEHQLSQDGHELSFATNLLNHCRLTQGLIDRGLLAEDAIVINMSSGGMYNVPLKIDQLNILDPDNYDGVLAYAYQKRAQVVLNSWWRKQHADKDWHFYVMHPGWVDTEGVKTSLPGFRALFQHVLRDAPAGADTAIWLASARPQQNDRGAIWFDRKEQSAHLGKATRRNSDSAEALVEFLSSL